MSTSAPSNIFAQDTDAHFQLWYNGVITMLFTALGVVQTADTGQIGLTATRPASSTSAGYVIGRFNDPLQSTVPIFFKLEFGSGVANTNPQMWLTVGTGSNGSGTITNGGGGAVSTRCSLMNGSAATGSGALVSRACYLNTTQAAILWLAVAYGGVTVGGSTNASYGGFVIMRTTDASGNASGTGITILTVNNGAGSLAGGLTNGFEQNISIANAAVIPAAPANGWNSLPSNAFFVLSLTSTLEGSTAFVAPCYTVDPVIRYSAYAASVLISDFAVGSTTSLAIVGANPMTFISAGNIFGSLLGMDGSTQTTRSLVLPWQ
jgi:hypothetical protein